MRNRLVFLSLTITAVMTHSYGLAGNLDSPATPAESGSAMFTATDLYNRLASGLAGAKRTGGFVEPVAGPGSTGYTIDQIMAIAPQADNTSGASPGNVQTGKTFWGLRTDGSWGPKTGALAYVGQQNITPGVSNQNIIGGIHAGTGIVSGDPDLTTGNIRSGVNIFGVSGKPQVIDTTMDATAANNGDIRPGKRAFVNGNQLVGNMTEGGNVTGPDGQKSFTIPDGLYTGNKTATANDPNLKYENIKKNVTILGVTGSPTVVDTSSGTATPTSMLNGYKGWVNGVEITGTMPVQSLNPGSPSVPGGLYSTTSLVSVDADLNAVNIKGGVTIFGITGSLAPAPVPKTGQTISYTTSDDGDLKKGMGWPSPRFTDNSNGTVTDNLTNLVWLKDANCITSVQWAAALTQASSLASGSCGLTDGSTAGQWRMPNLRELFSLVDLGQNSPALPTDHPFTLPAAPNFWTSTSFAGDTAKVWQILFNDLGFSNIPKTYARVLWPVRGGE